MFTIILTDMTDEDSVNHQVPVNGVQVTGTILRDGDGKTIATWDGKEYWTTPDGGRFTDWWVDA